MRDQLQASEQVEHVPLDVADLAGQYLLGVDGPNIESADIQMYEGRAKRPLPRICGHDLKDHRTYDLNKAYLTTNCIWATALERFKRNTTYRVQVSGSTSWMRAISRAHKRRR